MILANCSLNRSRSRIKVGAKILKFILSERLKMLFMVQGKWLQRRKSRIRQIVKFADFLYYFNSIYEKTDITYSQYDWLAIRLKNTLINK